MSTKMMEGIGRNKIKDRRTNWYRVKTLELKKTLVNQEKLRTMKKTCKKKPLEGLLTARFCQATGRAHRFESLWCEVLFASSQ